MKIAYVFCDTTLIDFNRIKQLGFDTVLGNFTLDNLNKIQDVGLQCILANQEFIDHPAIISYYLYDEPDFNKVPLEEQEAKIVKYRQLTNKPLSIACIEQYSKKCSSNFDWYMYDAYYMTEIGKYKKLINYANIMFSTHVLRVLYKKKLFIPIMGLFDDSTEYKWSEDYAKNFLPFAKKLRSYFRWTEDQAIFNYAWRHEVGGGNYYTGIEHRLEYICAATELNLKKPEKCWWITSKCLLTIAYVLIWFRKYIITDRIITWFNNRLPSNMKFKK